MRRVFKITILGIAVFSLGAVVGLPIGYIYGLTDEHGREAPINAHMTSLALNKIRDGDNQGAIDLLESRLDLFLMKRWVFDQTSHPFSWILYSEETASKLMRLPSDYRVKYPNLSADEDVRSALTEVVDKYKSIKPSNQSLKHGTPHGGAP